MNWREELPRIALLVLISVQLGLTLSQQRRVQVIVVPPPVECGCVDEEPEGLVIQ